MEGQAPDDICEDRDVTVSDTNFYKLIRTFEFFFATESTLTNKP